MNKYVGDDLPSKVTGLVNTSIEAVVAEVIDNSLDKNAETIHVDIQGTNWKNIHIIVYDNSEKGFESATHLDDAFRMGGDKKREEGEIGTFHMGAKASTLSKFNDVAFFTRIDDEIHHRRLNAIEIKEEYVPRTDILFPDKDEVNKKLTSKKWKTAVCLNNPKQTFLNVRSDIIKTSELLGFSKGLAMFLGIIYEQKLIKSPSLKITINKEKVTPIDPFWNHFTPASIQEMLDIPKGEIGHISDKIQRNTLLCTIPWGTVATKKVTIPIFYDGEEHNISVQGFVIPYGLVRKKLNENGLVTTEFTEKPSNAGTDTLKSQFMQGFFFYREGRCIGFGNTGKNSNDGWYTYGGGRANTWLGVRFKVEFPESLDDYMGLSPAKDTVNPETGFFESIQIAWDQRISEPKLRAKLGDGKRPFWTYTEPGKSVVGSAASSKLQSNMWVDGCDDCDGFHPKGSKCHFSPCEYCNLRNCVAPCQQECEFCKLKRAHLFEKCNLNCDLCGQKGGHELGEECSMACSECKKEHSKCDCLCSDCGKPKLSECECVKNCIACEKPEQDCICDQADSEKEVYPEAKLFELTLYRKNKSQNIELIQEALTFLDINVSEL